MIIEYPPLSEKGHRMLEKNGYTFIRYLGEGYNRRVYQVINPFSKYQVTSFAAKLEKEKESSSSIQHKIHLTKEGLWEQELEILEKVIHPNIARQTNILRDGSFKISIQEYGYSQSLNDYVKDHGNIRNSEFFKKIANQMLDALEYLHCEKKILHRDIKPSNFLFSRTDDKILLTDFENSKYIDKISSSLLPTRGSTPYTHPKLLNSLLKKELHQVDVSSELFSYGATLFYLLTGQTPFPYMLLEDTSGTRLEIGKKSLNVILLDKDKSVTSITPQSHQLHLQDALAKVPSKYHELLSHCLNYDTTADHKLLKSMITALPNKSEDTNKTITLENIINQIQELGVRKSKRLTYLKEFPQHRQIETFVQEQEHYFFHTASQSLKLEVEYTFRLDELRKMWCEKIQHAFVIDGKLNLRRILKENSGFGNIVHYKIGPSPWKGV